MTEQDRVYDQMATWLRETGASDVPAKAWHLWTLAPLSLGRGLLFSEESGRLEAVPVVGCFYCGGTAVWVDDDMFQCPACENVVDLNDYLRKDVVTNDDTDTDDTPD